MRKIIPTKHKIIEKKKNIFFLIVFTEATHSNATTKIKFTTVSLITINILTKEKKTNKAIVII